MGCKMTLPDTGAVMAQTASGGTGFGASPFGGIDAPVLVVAPEPKRSVSASGHRRRKKHRSGRRARSTGSRTPKSVNSTPMPGSPLPPRFGGRMLSTLMEVQQESDSGLSVSETSPSSTPQEDADNPALVTGKTSTDNVAAVLIGGTPLPVGSSAPTQDATATATATATGAGSNQADHHDNAVSAPSSSSLDQQPEETISAVREESGEDDARSEAG